MRLRCSGGSRPCVGSEQFGPSLAGESMTIGWIYEDDVERFCEATERPFVPKRTQLHCPFCGEVAATSRALIDHLHSAHAIRRPALLLAGREPARIDVVRHPVAETEVEALDCQRTEVGVDGAELRSTTATELGALLQSEGSRRLRVRLSSDARGRGVPAATEYDLRVTLPSQADLGAADREFVETFGVGAPHIASIDTFAEGLRRGASSEYVEGLVEYVRGVLIKDRDPRTGVRDGRAQWPDAYKRALHILSDFPRPLPILLCGLMRLALNDFSAWKTRSDFPGLDRSLEVFGSLAEGVTPATPRITARKRRIRGVCPIDAGVSRVIELVDRSAGLTRWSVQDDDELRVLTESDVLGPLDRAKARAVWAWSVTRLGVRATGAEPLRSLLGNDAFGAWAATTLEGVEVAV